MVIRYPGLIEPGSRPEQMVLSIDLASTILHLAGQEPEDPMQGGLRWSPSLAAGTRRIGALHC